MENAQQKLLDKLSKESSINEIQNYIKKIMEIRGFNKEKSYTMKKIAQITYALSPALLVALTAQAKESKEQKNKNTFCHHQFLRFLIHELILCHLPLNVYLDL